MPERLRHGQIGQFVRNGFVRLERGDGTDSPVEQAIRLALSAQ